MDADLLTTKLHTAPDGRIWAACGNEQAEDTRRNLLQFMFALPQYGDRFRLVGSHDNAQLITALRAYEPRVTVELCSPAVCRPASMCKDAMGLIAAARLFERPASTGGWREMRKADDVPYAMASYMQKHGRVDEAVRCMLRAHPVWPSLSFVPHLNQGACAALVSEILDPRWFADLRRPASGSKLRAKLGLDRPTVDAVMNGRGHRNAAQCRLAITAWRGDAKERLVERPDHFLLRAQRYAAERHGEVVGVLRATQAFVEFLRLTWLAALGAGRHQLEALFVPAYYFQSDAEVQAYNEHVRRMTTNVER